MIKLIHVTKTYFLGDGVQALRNASLTIAPNDYVGILGPSGSGKSTLLYMMGLLDIPTEGTVIFEGRDTARLSDVELSALRGKSIGFVFQFYHLVPHLTVMENVELPLYYQGLDPWERHDRAKVQISKVNLSHRARHLPAELSGGERQRVAIARALVTDPRLILADEPTGNLDSRSGAEILAILEQLHTQGKTVVMITHDLSIARRFPRVIRISDGVLQEGSSG
ncbi:MAG: ABC transporter ATP-binding protein [Verrucomicrobia bacterium]|nr:ABC transporter ATP-binding protein [Verrucomicrobiota bacterium]MCG2680444.1 ABC transporter ATP-binding protein [Kiritimatiellia bacterium]MBU4247557.1 ABC transporter ATP-binding protein [Verrucomicrobiota bacterium]MBU4291255.1 ABC transporter ATP-binding protein [Verrucomicrobiota bacterium]MBU4428993.1 ABC transporter ATP-binding protein [Verrucomicrobiota bacterium]